LINNLATNAKSKIMNEENKLIDETLESFFEQFGSLDIYTKIVLEEFFKEIMK